MCPTVCKYIVLFCIYLVMSSRELFMYRLTAHCQKNLADHNLSLTSFHHFQLLNKFNSECIYWHVSDDFILFKVYS